MRSVAHHPRRLSLTYIILEPCSEIYGTFCDREEEGQPCNNCRNSEYECIPARKTKETKGTKRKRNPSKKTPNPLHPAQRSTPKAQPARTQPSPNAKRARTQSTLDDSLMPHGTPSTNVPATSANEGTTMGQSARSADTPSVAEFDDLSTFNDTEPLPFSAICT